MDQRQAVKKRMADAKARALKHRLNRGSFNSEPYMASMDIGLALQVIEIDNKFDGRDDLTDIKKPLLKLWLVISLKLYAIAFSMKKILKKL